MTSALAYLHDKKLRHRDIKPENIIFEKSGKFVLIDFNIATSNVHDLDKVGTWPYLAPDLMNGQTMQWEDSADTFALGITLYELLTHSYPWPGKRIPVLDKKPADIMSLNSLISPDFGAFVMKAINTRHENRFKAAKEMLEAVEAIGESGISKKT